MIIVAPSGSIIHQAFVYKTSYKVVVNSWIPYGRSDYEMYAVPCDLMFFWPCIMNWLYINYQLDALIIIYS